MSTNIDERRAKKAAYMRDWYARNRDRVVEIDRARRAADPERFRLKDHKRNQARYGDPEYLAYVRDRRYNLAPGRHQEMLDAQEGRCAICLREFGDGVMKPHVDHDHSCCAGQKSCGACVRGLLCAHCNQALGLLRDDRDRLLRAIDYLAS